MFKCLRADGCPNGHGAPCSLGPGVCVARQAVEAERSFPDLALCPRTQSPCGSTACDPLNGDCAHHPVRVLHANLRPEEAERRVDESRVPSDGAIFAAVSERTTGPFPPTPERTIPRYPAESASEPVVTNTPRAGESPEATAARSPGRRALDAVKDTNPKDAIGVLKIAISFISLPVILEVALGMMEGAFKYGRHNYREAGVRASVYVDATFRHLAAFWEGEDYDPDIFENTDVKVSHITKAIASLTVLRDSMIRGNWVDDRPPAVEAGWIAKLSRDVKKLAAKYPNPVPPVTEIGLRAKKDRAS